MRLPQLRLLLVPRLFYLSFGAVQNPVPVLLHFPLFGMARMSIVDNFNVPLSASAACRPAVSISEQIQIQHIERYLVIKQL